MLHEILLALFGHTGSVIIESEDKFIVNSKLTFLSQAEIELLNRIALLGFLFKQIQKFQEQYGGISTKLALQLAYDNQQREQDQENENMSGNGENEENEDQDDELHGVYIKAYCSGVNEIMGVYKEHLLAIEHEYLKDRSLTISQLQQKLSIYYQIFPALISINQEIEEHGLKGGQLLDAVQQRCTTGNPVIKAMFTKILFCCHRVLFHQINAWIVHGQLVDLCEEFFIHKINSSNNPLQQKEHSAQDQSKLNKTQTSGASISNLNLVGSILTMDPENFGAEDDAKDDEWNAVYTLRISMLPCSYFPPSLAEKILFIGKAVRVLQSKKTQLQDRIPISDLEAFSEAIMKLQKMPEFNILLFSKVIEGIRECIASRLLHLVVIKADLIQHLKAIKDYFLLSKGEFYQTFLEEARSIMSLPPQSSSEIDINQGPLQQTIIKLGLEEDNYLRRFKLKLRSFQFHFNNFSNLNGLFYIGNVYIDQQRNYAFRIKSSKNSRKSGALWHSLKQRIDMGFRTIFKFKFRNPLIHGVGGMGMNASIISGSIAGSPGKYSTRNFYSQDQNSIMHHPSHIRSVIGGYNQTQMSIAGGEDSSQQQNNLNLGQVQLHASLNFIIQNEKEVIRKILDLFISYLAWKKATPESTLDLNSYISVKLLSIISPAGGILNPNQRVNYFVILTQVQLSLLKQQFNLQSFIQIWGSQETSIGKIKTIIDDGGQGIQSKNETLIAEREISLDGFEFMDGEPHCILVEYANEELRVFLLEENDDIRNKKEPILKVNLKLSDYIKLDNGTAHLGFTHETLNLTNDVAIENWTFVSDAKSNQQDPWNGLSLDYRTHWPLHLMFSPDVIEKYNTLFRFLLPIKRSQLELQHIWALKVRSMKRYSGNPAFRKTMLLRQHMSFLIDNIFSYLQVDVLESQWSKLEKAINESQDFEEVRLLHDKYLASITEQCFLNLNQVLKGLQDIMQMCQNLCRLLQQMDNEAVMDEDFQQEFAKIKSNFERQSNMVFRILSNFKHYHQSSPYLAQLLLRIDYNKYMSDLSEKIEIERNQMTLGGGAVNRGGGINKQY